MPDAREYLRANKVTLVDVRVGPCASSDLGKKCSGNDPHAPLALYRFDWYLEQLDKLQNEGSLRDDARVLLTDTRDSFFQANPFHNPEHPGSTLSFEGSQDLATFLEFAAVPIADEGINRGWINSCWGDGEGRGLDAEFDGRRVRENSVSCSGTVMGTIAGLRRYLGVMIAEIKKKQCKSYGIDQGYHNWLLHSGRLGAENVTRRFPQGTGPVNTVGLLTNAKLPLPRDAEGFVLNRDGTRSAQVHQWDRYWDEFILQGWLERYSMVTEKPWFNRC